MLRVTLRAHEGVESLVIEGELVGPWIGELRHAVEGALDRGGRVELHLAGLRFAAPEGACLLRELVARGATVTRSTQFVDELMRS